MCPCLAFNMFLFGWVLMMAGMLMLCGMPITMGVGVELIHAVLGTEVERLPGVFAGCERGFLVDHHSAYRVFDHFEKPPLPNAV